MSQLSRKQQMQKRHRRLRRHISGTSDRPRLAVFRSNNHIYAQVIDDGAQSTLCSASTVDKEVRSSLQTHGRDDQSRTGKSSTVDHHEASPIRLNL